MFGVVSGRDSGAGKITGKRVQEAVWPVDGEVVNSAGNLPKIGNLLSSPDGVGPWGYAHHRGAHLKHSGSRAGIGERQSHRAAHTILVPSDL